MRVKFLIILLILLNFSIFGDIFDTEDGFIVKIDGKIVEICKGERIEQIEKRTREIVKRSTGENRQIKDYKISYLGNTFYIFTYRIFMNSQFLFSISVDPFELAIVDGKIQKTYSKSSQKTGDLIQDKKIENIKKMKFYLNSLSTSIGMILTYGSNIGKKNLRLEKEEDEAYIREINKICASCLEIPAIEIFCASRGYNAKTKTITTENENYLKFIEGEIKNNRPVLTKITSWGLVHYGVLYGIKNEEKENYGLIYLPVKNGPTYEIEINFNQLTSQITFTLIDIK